MASSSRRAPTPRPRVERGSPSALGLGERTAVAAGALVLIALLAMPWFAVEAHGEIAFGSEGGAFRWLGGIDLVVLTTGLVAVVLPLLRRYAVIATDASTLGVLTAAAGLTASVLILYRIVVDPHVPQDFFLDVGIDPAAQVVARVGTAFALVGSIGVLAGGSMTALQPTSHGPVSRRKPVPGSRARPAIRR